MGVDSFKTDFGERIPTDVVYYDGSDPEKMHNYYTYLYNKVVYEVLEEKQGAGEAVLSLARRLRAVRSFPSTGEGIVLLIMNRWRKVCAAACRSACPASAFGATISADLKATRRADVYKSAGLAFGLLSTTAACTAVVVSVPWLYDEEAVDVTAAFSPAEVPG